MADTSENKQVRIGEIKTMVEMMMKDTMKQANHVGARCKFVRQASKQLALWKKEGTQGKKNQLP